MADDFSEIQQILADQVKARRKAMSFSQEKLAFDAKIGHTYVSQIERGLINPSLKGLWRFSVYFKPICILCFPHPGIGNEFSSENGHVRSFAYLVVLLFRIPLYCQTRRIIHAQRASFIADRHQL